MKMKSFLVIFIISFQTVLSAPSRRFNDDAELNTTITTRVIDLDNPEHASALLQQFNLSATELRQLRGTPAITAETPTSLPSNRRTDDIKDLRVHIIRNQIENIYHGQVETPSSNNELPTHEMAAYPTCTHLNETAWQQENNLTIRFSASLFEASRPYMYLDSAVLRLHKVDPAATSDLDCDEITELSQIRVTISTIQYLRKSKREKKKRICNTMMVNRTHTGWIEMDIKKAINIWEKSERQNMNTNCNNRIPVLVGWLTIEVHDEDEQPLKPGLYFDPPKCSETSGLAVPWNFYQSPNPGSMYVDKISRSPRVDVKFLENFSFGSHRQHYHNCQHHHNTHKTISHRQTNPSFSYTTIPSSENFHSSSSSELHSHKRRHHQENHSAHHLNQRHHYSTGTYDEDRSQQEDISRENIEIDE